MGRQVHLLYECVIKGTLDANESLKLALEARETFGKAESLCCRSVTTKTGMEIGRVRGRFEDSTHTGMSRRECL